MGGDHGGFKDNKDRPLWEPDVSGKTWTFLSSRVKPREHGYFHYPFTITSAAASCAHDPTIIIHN